MQLLVEYGFAYQNGPCVDEFVLVNYDIMKYLSAINVDQIWTDFLDDPVDTVYERGGVPFPNLIFVQHSAALGKVYSSALQLV